MNAATVAHRWANKDFGRNNTLTASRSCHSEGRTYYSYSTVFGQWVDIEKNVVLIYIGGTSPTSSKYKLHKSDFPDDVHVLPYDDGGYGYYHGCRLLSTWNTQDEDFTTERKIELLDYYVQEMYEQFRFIRDSKVKGLENVSFEIWGYFEELCSLYKDISVAKYLKTLKHIKQLKRNGEVFNKEKKEHIKKCNAEVDAKKVMVKHLADGERNVETITDAMFGAGTYKSYWDYSARFRKADAKKKHLEALCERLGIVSPYVGYWRNYRNAVDCDLSPADIRKLTAKQRNEIHFRNLAIMEERKQKVESGQKFAQRMCNAYKWVTGTELKGFCGYGDTVHEVKQAVNMFTKEGYNLKKDIYASTYGLKTDVYFRYNNFRNNRDTYLQEFYAECKEVAENIEALNILKRVKANIMQIDYSRALYVADECLRENTTEEEYAKCLALIERQEAAHRERQTRERLERIERERAEAERKREEEHLKQVKREQIAECLARGTEGCLDLWRKHLTTIGDARNYFNDVAFKDEGEFFNGGNVLLRFNLDRTRIETSMGIHISIAQAKQLWKLIQKWHNNPASFERCTLDTKASGKYTAVSYKNDILTAGCHKIAWTEMERMWNEIVKLENVA